MRRVLAVHLTLFVMLSGCAAAPAAILPTLPPSSSTPPSASLKPSPSAVANIDETYDVGIVLRSDLYPETMAHIAEAIASGHPVVCTIDRAGAEKNREESLRGVETKKGYDRDEWPMAMCAEGGEGADIAYVTPKDNRGAGSMIGNKLEDYANGTRVKFFVIDVTEISFVTPTTTTKPIEAASPTPSKKPEPTKAPAQIEDPVELKERISYANCNAVRVAGADPIYKGDPGYSSKLDRDGDGVACE